MSIFENTTPKVALTFQLKGGLYPLTVLQLLGTELLAFEQQLNAKIQQAPKFFHYAPVVIDLQKLNQAHTPEDCESTLDFNHLVDMLRRKKLIPVGIKGGSAYQQTAASTAGLAILQDNAKEFSKVEETNPKIMNRQAAPTASFTTTSTETEIRALPSKIIADPVRSGQQIYARNSDLIVLAPVSHGAELLADGNIHIYGPLRGRALAGVNGDEKTHIFCQSLEAELVSIAGQYKISEDIDQTLWHTAVDICIEKGHLHIRSL
jgi:septum site-determining protein MinC